MTRWLGNGNNMEVHDLSNEQTNCQISEIKREHRRPFPSLEAAHRAGYDNCYWCIGGSKR